MTIRTTLSIDIQKTEPIREETMTERKERGIHPAAGSAPAAAAQEGSTGANSSRAAWLPASAWPASARVAKIGIGPAFAQDRPLTPTFYQWIEDLHPGIPAVNEQVPRHQLPDRAGRGLRHRALRRRGQEQGKHLGRLCRPDAVRRNVGDDRGRRHRAVGRLHPEGRARRHHPLDPRREHDRRQALWLAVPARCDRQLAGIRA